jgi:hypothetical protein
VPNINGSPAKLTFVNIIVGQICLSVNIFGLLMKSGINDGDNDDDDMDNKEGRNGGKKRGDNNDDSSASMGSNSSTSLSDEVVT